MPTPQVTPRDGKRSPRRAAAATSALPAAAAQPKRLSGAERREHILDTSMRVFAERGFSATKTKDLAIAAGVSEALIFKLFPDKEHLYRALIERKIQHAETMLPLQDLASSNAPPARFFGRIADVILEHVERDPSFLRLILFSALEGHPLAAEFDAARVRGFRAAIATYVRRKQRTGELRRCDAEFAARMFMGVVGAFVQARTICRDEAVLAVPRKRLARDIVNAFLKGLEA